jgi:hypothetical protein
VTRDSRLSFVGSISDVSPRMYEEPPKVARVLSCKVLR